MTTDKRAGIEKTRVCDDCGREFTGLTDQAVKRGNTVRDPGDIVCRGCRATRTTLFREVLAIPDRLGDTKRRGVGRPPHITAPKTEYKL